MVAVGDRRDGWWSDLASTEGFQSTGLGFGKSKGSGKEKQNAPHLHLFRSAVLVCLDTVAFVRDVLTQSHSSETG